MYGPNPSELEGLAFVGCTPPEDAAAPTTTYRVTVHFLVPVQARPVAVRVTVLDELPRYARLLAPR